MKNASVVVSLEPPKYLPATDGQPSSATPKKISSAAVRVSGAYHHLVWMRPRHLAIAAQVIVRTNGASESTFSWFDLTRAMVASNHKGRLCRVVQMVQHHH